jgi:c-di-GMP-binding flagellar brake protein YcgR
MEAYRGERRRHPRVSLPFPVTVQGTDEAGEPFQFSTILDDLSAGGLRLRLMRRMRTDSELLVTARLSINPEQGAVVALQGKVLRVEPESGGVYGVAVRIEQHTFL